MVRSALWENRMDEGAMNNVMPVCMVLPLGCTVGLFLGVYTQRGNTKLGKAIV